MITILLPTKYAGNFILVADTLSVMLKGDPYTVAILMAAYAGGLPPSGDDLLTEGGAHIVTESGDNIVI